MQKIEDQQIQIEAQAMETENLLKFMGENGLDVEKFSKYLEKFKDA